MELPQPDNHKSKRQRALVASVAVIVGITLLFGLLGPRPAQAQVPMPSQSLIAAIWKEIKDNARWVYDKAKAAYNLTKKVGGDVAFKNGLRVFLGKVAEDTAVWVSSAGTGQKPLFITDPHYWTNLSNAAAGDFLDTISKYNFGISICEPLDVNKKLQIEIAVRGLSNPLNFCQNTCNSRYNAWQEDVGRIVLQYVSIFKNYYQQKPEETSNCPYSEMFNRLVADSPTFFDTYTVDSPFHRLGEDTVMSYAECYALFQSTYDAANRVEVDTRDRCLKDCNKTRRKAACTATEVWNNIRDIEDFSLEVSSFFEPEQNDIGQILTLYGLTQDKINEEVLAEKTIQSGDLGSITSKLRTDILTPSSLARAKAEQPIVKAQVVEETQTGSTLADAIGVFTNTLTQRLMDRFFKSKCGLNPSACKGPGQTESRLGGLLFGSNAPAGIAAARLQFSTLAKIDYRVGDPGKTQVDVANRLLSNGIINNGFQQAIEEKLTLREAIEKGLIDPNLTFGFDENDAEAERGIPYRSIVYLRKYRVVPVGWELAALHIRDKDQRAYGLKELMDLYDFCGQDPLHGIPNPGEPGSTLASPFCGLVDPGWVLKAPATYCRRQGSGDEIISRQFVCAEDTNGDGTLNCSQSDIGGGDLGTWVISRNQDTCVDEPSCIKEDATGNCLAYGYCYEERPIWRFGGDECPGYYATCRSFTNSGGTTVAYLKNTINTADCSADNAGCRGLCTAAGYNGSDQTYNCTAGGPTNRYLDRDAQTCTNTAAGCTELVRTGNGSNVLANGSFEFFTGTIDDGASDTFGFCSDNGQACSIDPDCAGRCQGWKQPGGSAAEAITSDNSGVGSPNTTALALSGGLIEHEADPGQPLSGLTAIFSFYGRAAGGDCSGSFGIRSTDDLFRIESDPAPSFSSAWQRYSMTATFPERTYDQPTVSVFISAGCAVALDSAKLEYGSQLTVYTDYQSVNEVSLKIPEATLVTNGDFAQDNGKDFFTYPDDPAADNATANDSIPDGWIMSGTGGISTAGYTDTRSLKLDSNNNRSYASQIVPVEYGKTYEVSGWIKTELSGGATKPYGSILTECLFGTDHEPPLDLFFPSEDEPSSCLLANYEAYLKPASLAGGNEYIVQGNHDWTFVRFTLTANNPDIPFMKVSCFNKADAGSDVDDSGSGSVWCDNIRVTESALSCANEEVGCQRYKPVGPGTTVSGVVRPGDLCPADQIGCRQFRELPIERIPARDAVDPVRFIETSGRTCTAAQVGCEEYTNLDVEAAGGEAREYFTRIRQCVQPSDPNAANFYTWEGSEESGFQLRAFKLLKSSDAGPCTNLSVGTTAVAPVCTDTAATIASCTPEDIGINPDCTEFFNESGAAFYRLRSRTIAVSADCHPYRNTIDAAAGVDNIYTVLAGESVSCSAGAASCRQFKGTTAGASRTVYAEPFESGSVNGWDGGTYSNESITVNGHSLRSTAGTWASIELSNSIQNSGAYSAKFWFKAREDGDVQFRIRGTADGKPDQVIEAGLVNVTKDWASYEAGPMYVNFTNEPSKFYLEFAGAGGWIDTISLVESIDSVYRIEGTTTSCDADYVGCRLYTDKDNQSIALTGFSSLCSDRAVGCEALTLTQNSNYPFSQSVQDNPALRTPPDATVAYVNSAAARCRQEDQGCSTFGLPTLDESNAPIAWTSSSLIDDPDLYASAMCKPSQEWCEEFTDELDNTKSYFRDPGSRTCEYRQGVAQAGLLVDGWFITGTNMPCPSSSMTCSGGMSAGAACSSAAEQQLCITNGGTCIAYPLDGETKEVNLFCASTCQGGGSPPDTACFSNSECSNVCRGGSSDGLACSKDGNCPGGTCDIGICGDGSARPLCDGRRTGQAGGPTGDQQRCLNDGGTCKPLPAIGKPAKTCLGGPLNGGICSDDASCCSAGDCGDPAAVCTPWAGICDPGAAGCTEFRDPLDPPQQPKYPGGCNVNCTFATDRSGNELKLGPECQPNPSNGGKPGCQPYYILRQSLADQVSECNSQIDFQIGCQPFYDTDNPTTSFLGE